MSDTALVRSKSAPRALPAQAAAWGWPLRMGAAVLVAIGLVSGTARANASQPSYEPFGSADAPAWTFPGKAERPANPAPTPSSPRSADAGPCVDCGVVESVKKVDRGGLAGSLPANLPNGVGSIAGGVLGAVVGRAFGDSSSAKNIGTVVGAAGGALLGHQLEKYLRQPRFEVVVRLPDGQVRTLEQSTEVAVGQAVVIENGEAKPRVRGTVQPAPAAQPEERRAQPQPGDASREVAPNAAPVGVRAGLST